MYCPVCKAEYRHGITHCHDCDVDLVTALPADPVNVYRQKEIEGQEAVPLWSEDNPIYFAALLNALDEGGIPHYEFQQHDPRANLNPIFPGRAYMGLGQEVWVRASDLPSAKKLLETVMDRQSELPEGQGEPLESLSAEPEPVQKLPEHWDPRAATVNVWSGEEEWKAQFILDALLEGGIPAKVDNAGFAQRILVRPEDESRAREVVRQVLEGAPPK
jgi:hypothetical protein